MKAKRFAIAVIVLGLLASLTGGAGATGGSTPMGTAFTYQGRLSDASGPLNSECDLTFKLYDAPGLGTPPVGGTLLGTVVANDTAIVDGLFTVRLDFGAGAFDGTARWLEIAVDCGSGPVTLSPRQELTPAPYAILANENWALLGNVGTAQGTHFLGTTDAVSLTLKVNDTVAFEIEPTEGTPNLIGGHEANSTASGIEGATIGGGGTGSQVVLFAARGAGSVSVTAANIVTGSYGTIGGGASNLAGEYATVGGGDGNVASAPWTTVSGGGAYYYPDRVSMSRDALAGAQPALVGKMVGNVAASMWGTIGGGGGNYVGPAPVLALSEENGSSEPVEGVGATIGGGGLNMAVGPASTIGGGLLNAAMAAMATIGGGGPYYDVPFPQTADARTQVSLYQGNRVLDDYGTVSGGGSNQAGSDDSSTESSQFATVGGGQSNVASGYASTVVGGVDAHASHYGEQAYASGAFQYPGDAQASVYLLRGVSTGIVDQLKQAGWAELFLDGASERITVPEGRSLTFDILVVARDGSGTSFGCRIEGVIENEGGTTQFVGGGPANTFLGRDDLAWDIRAVADDTNDALIVEVQGAVGARWVASVRTVEVSMPTAF